MNKKIIATMVAAYAIMGASFFGVMSVQARDLTIVGWGGEDQQSLSEDIFQPFSTLNNIPLVEDSWNGGYGILQSKVQAGTPNWDLVQVEAEELVLGCQDGIFEKLDWSKIGDKNTFIDGTATDCGVGAYIWSLAMAFDKSKYPDGGPQNWADFWDLKKYPGKRALRKGPKYNLEFALLADGVPKDEIYDVLSTPEGVDRAFKKLDEIKSDVIWWESGTQPMLLLLSGDIAMGGMYIGRVDKINKTENRDIAIVWNESSYATDSWVILKNSPNVENATKFLNYYAQVEHQLMVPNKLAVGLVVKEAAEQVPEERAKDLPSYPEYMAEAFPLDVDFWIDNLEALSTRYNAWLAQ